MAERALETCGNCGRAIGKLETPMVWKEHIVCSGCRKILAAERESPREQPADESHPAVLDPREVLPGEVAFDVTSGMPEYIAPAAPNGCRDERICPNPKCTYEGEGQIRKRGSWITLIFLLIIGLLPGIIYAIFFSGHSTFCPKCGMEWGRTQWMKLDSKR